MHSIEFNTDYNADSVEFCIERPLLACGTYQVQESQRLGRILLFSVHPQQW
jgi:hypothetical protein